MMMMIIIIIIIRPKYQDQARVYKMSMNSWSY